MWPLIIIPVLIAGVAISANREIKAIEEDFAEHERTNCRQGAKHALSERLYASPKEYTLSTDDSLQRRQEASRVRCEKRAAAERAEQERKEAEWQAFCKRMGVIKYERA